jgi:diaminopimelate decarboxylase/aspartate kinase
LAASLDNSQSWVVLKFGGTSVSSADNWRNIVAVLRARLAEGLHPVVVHSALSGVTDRLESLLTAALAGKHSSALEHLETIHRDLAQRLGIVPSERFEEFLADLRGMAANATECREISDRLRARVMATGELLATSLGESFLNAQGIGTVWKDARQVLRAEPRHGATEQAGLLSATCDFAPDVRLQAEWHALGQ